MLTFVKRASLELNGISDTTVSVMLEGTDYQCAHMVYFFKVGPTGCAT